jgi:hypothetical protein
MLIEGTKGPKKQSFPSTSFFVHKLASFQVFKTALFMHLSSKYAKNTAFNAQIIQSLFKINNKVTQPHELLMDETGQAYTKMVSFKACCLILDLYRSPCARKRRLHVFSWGPEALGLIGDSQLW